MRTARALSLIGMLTAGCLCSAAAADLRWGQAAIPAGPATLNAAGEGRRDYLKFNCYSCHGMNAAGGMGPNIQHAEGGDVNEAVLDGEEGGMPSFRKRLGKADIRRITAYLASIGTKAEPTWVDWWVPVPQK